jgi:hypothetical protein
MAKKRPADRRQIFKCQSYVVDEDADSGDVSVVFPQDRTMNLLRFSLRAAERHRFGDETYINSLVSAYHRDPGHFAQKRKVSAA